MMMDPLDNRDPLQAPDPAEGSTISATAFDGGMNRYLQLFRVGNAVMGFLGVMIASLMAVGTDLPDHWRNLAISAIIVFMFISGGNSFNDYIDREIDKTAHPERPVPSGRMRPEEARNIGAILLILSVAVSFLTFDPVCIAIVAIACVLMFSYELFLKQRGFVGNVTIAVLTGMTFLLGGAVVGAAEANMVVAAMACLVSVGREIAKDIEDMDSDEGRHTLPMAIGTRASAVIACAFFIAGPLLSIAPMVWDSYGVLYYLVVLADIAFFYCAYIVFSDPHKAEKTAKIGMMLGLVAFLLGALF